MKKRWKLANALIISFVVMVWMLIGIIFIISIIGKSNDAIFFIRELECAPIEYFDEGFLKLIIFDNSKYLIKALICSIIGLFMIILIVAHFMKINREDKKKQIKNLILVTFIFILILFCINLRIIILEENIQVSISIVLKSKITVSDQNKIEDILKEIDEIIEYEYISSEERL